MGGATQTTQFIYFPLSSFEKKSKYVMLTIFKDLRECYIKISIKFGMDDY
jgi:hypothetical protein